MVDEILLNCRNNIKSMLTESQKKANILKTICVANMRISKVKIYNS